MKFIIPIVRFMCACVGCVAAKPFSDLLKGEWIQIYSNYFVQSTTEIDWKCVRISIAGNNNALNVTTKAFVHGIPSEDISILHTYNVSTASDNTTILTNQKEKLRIRKSGLLEENNLDYVVLTPANNISLYVWTRNFSRFMNEYNTDVLKALDEWQYSGLYKAPLFSYTTRCLE